MPDGELRVQKAFLRVEELGKRRHPHLNFLANDQFVPRVYLSARVIVVLTFDITFEELVDPLLALKALHGVPVVCLLPQNLACPPRPLFIRPHGLRVDLVVTQRDPFVLHILLTISNRSFHLRELLTDVQQEGDAYLDYPAVATRDQFEPALSIGFARFSCLEDRVEAVAATGRELFEEELVE